jgi:ATP-dependent DNA helicase RecQ
MYKVINEKFNEYFPDKTIKSLQYEIVKNIMDRNDTIAILPTGYGKSLCYQLPYLINPNKFVIVISPLIALMEDQKDKLEKLNIPVECFHSNKKKQNIKTHTLNNPMIIFLTPENIANCHDLLEDLVSNNKLSLIAIDEAHCISSWGNDFRPEYKELYKLKEIINDIPLLALTATATKQVENDMKKNLNLNNPKVFKTSFDRPNLLLNVLTKPTSFEEVFPIINNYLAEYSIIYCKTRNKAEEIDELLKENNYNSDVYHAGLSGDHRKKIQDKFASKQINIIVATVAFGMGIDQNVHLVIHWGCPSDMESYYQEIGRAGRDNLESKCYLYYDREDFRISRYFLKTIKNETYRKFRDEQISKMERFCMLPYCRKKTVLTHFEEKLDDNYKCNKCDNCYKQTDISNNTVNNILYPIFIIIKTVISIKCRIGAGKLSLILKGSKSKLIVEFNKFKTFGLLKELTDEQIKNLISLLLLNGYLKEKTIQSGFGTVLETTIKTITYYKKLDSQISSKDLYFDSINKILLNNIITLDIPVNFNNLSTIQFKTKEEKISNDIKDLSSD